MIHPRLLEEIGKQPDKEILQPFLCLPTPDSKRQLNAGWPGVVAEYQGKPNDDDLLMAKSLNLAAFTFYNLDVGIELYKETLEKITRDDGTLENGPELVEEQETLIKVEEAACWYRIIDELALGFLGNDRRPLFMDYFGENLVHLLALQGMPPELICGTMRDRVIEYGIYRKWWPEKNEGAKDTLLWEAAKHVASIMKMENRRYAYFVLAFGIRFLEKINHALVYELLTGHQQAKLR